MALTNLQSLADLNVGCMSPLPGGENGVSQTCFEFLPDLLIGDIKHPNAQCPFSGLPAQGLVALQVAGGDRMLMQMKGFVSFPHYPLLMTGLGEGLCGCPWQGRKCPATAKGPQAEP